jgi:hypothetical protein
VSVPHHSPTVGRSAAPPALWRRVVAAILDFLTAFIGSGSLVAYLTGDLTSTGFQLEGLPALCAFALVILYFVVGKRLGGPIWRRVLKAR